MTLSVFFDARKARDFGIGTYVKELLGALGERRDVAVTALIREGDAALFPSSVATVVSFAPHYSLSELVAVRRAFEASAAEVLHAPHYVVPLGPPRATVVTVHDLMHLSRPEHRTPAKRLYARVMVGRAVKAAARIVVGSRATRDEVAAFAPDAAEKIRLIPFGVDARFRPNVSSAERARVLAAHRVEKPYVLFLGNDKPHKNLDGLLHAFALYRKAVSSPARLVLAGGAGERRAARGEAIRMRGLEGDVDDVGVVPEGDVAPLLASAEALVLPSFAEGFGMPVVEAQASGIPVVCSERGGLVEAAGDAAVFVDPASPRSIAEGLVRVTNDAALKDDLVSRGLAHASSLSWRATAEKTVALYHEARDAR